MPSTGFRRRADLSGVFRISDRSVLVMSAEAAGSVEAGVGAVGVDVDLDPRLDEVGPQRAFGDLQFQRLVGSAIVVHDLGISGKASVKSASESRRCRWQTCASTVR